MQLHKRFESELVRRFLAELKEDERLALGSPPKISTIFLFSPPTKQALRTVLVRERGRSPIRAKLCDRPLVPTF